MRQAMNSRARFDEVMLQRKRREIFAELGEVVHQLVTQGALEELAHHPELAEIIADLDDITAQLEMAQPRDPGFTGGPARWRRGDRPDPVYPPTYPEGASEWSDWADWQDGSPDTVSSKDWTPPRPSSDDSGGPALEQARVWRPVTPAGSDHRVASQDDDPPGRAEPPASSGGAGSLASSGGAGSPPWQSTRRRTRSRRPGRGGIVFASDRAAPDDDLADYMHEDDIPDESAGPSASDSNGDSSAPDEAGNTP